MIVDEADYDVVVAGAGPAGSMTARQLARQGARVLLVDRSRFPRPKVCGCCLNPRALATLERAGLGGLTADLQAVALTGMELATAGRRASIDRPLGVALSRDALDAALIAAAVATGVEFLPATTAALRADSSADAVAVRLQQGERSFDVRGRFVVSSTGLTDGLFPAEARESRSPNAKIGAGAIAPAAPEGYEPGRIHMSCGDGGYVGLVVLEDGRLDLAAAFDPDAVREAGGLGRLAGSILAGAGLPPVPGVAALRWKGTSPLTRSPGRLVEGGVYRVGDSAGYVEPFTGEGMAWALAGGEALAATLAEALAGVEIDPAGRWALAHRKAVGRRQLVCRAAGRILRTPWMTRSLVGVLAFRPSLARPFLSIIHKAS
ncbi:NAD(P)/FAD-dependent oxidoreductase [Paludisphaera mucosa]|uniref:FAD-dependent monooxygenase n=1 Tax=Paludisphaera mucosa TaxID=3030827 RepID=A0ABT6F483_9BACT|nr:FAD-dependent oxidoreductase [Paludisphaera mucosa]MDG3002375.1 FAD-dependent monooxygenase [Paludisphaera mucosa]